MFGRQWKVRKTWNRVEFGYRYFIWNNKTQSCRVPGVERSAGSLFGLAAPIPHSLGNLCADGLNRKSRIGSPRRITSHERSLSWLIRLGPRLDRPVDGPKGFGLSLFIGPVLRRRHCLDLIQLSPIAPATPIYKNSFTSNLARDSLIFLFFPSLAGHR